MIYSFKIISTVILLWPLHAHADVVTQAMQLLEDQQMQLLAQQQRKPGVVIDAFRSDGCSGGMSETWGLVAGISPGIARVIGRQPPWEHCCVAHDKSYWRGESLNGFEKRLQADEALRACVAHTGEFKSTEISMQLGIPQPEVEEFIRLTADLMFEAVRLGGAPCTGLPWRWGHGWPECAPDLGSIIPVIE